jgi:hypothetical protein
MKPEHASWLPAILERLEKARQIAQSQEPLGESQGSFER